MKAFRILSIIAAAAGSLILSSCGCCTGEAEVPPLRPLPQFGPMPATGPIEVSPTK